MSIDLYQYTNLNRKIGKIIVQSDQRRDKAETIPR